MGLMPILTDIITLDDIGLATINDFSFELCNPHRRQLDVELIWISYKLGNGFFVIVCRSTGESGLIPIMNTKSTGMGFRIM